jgi:hypothetical protein
VCATTAKPPRGIAKGVLGLGGVAKGVLPSHYVQRDYLPELILGVAL